MDIRDELLDDHKAIRQVHLASFPGPEEADLVDRLRGDGDAVMSLVAIEGRVLTGHVMFSRMSGPFSALGLGPVAVLVDWRRKGIAAALIREGIRRATNDGWAGISFSAIRLTISALGSSPSMRTASNLLLPVPILWPFH